MLKTSSMSQHWLCDVRELRDENGTTWEAKAGETQKKVPRCDQRGYGGEGWYKTTPRAEINGEY